MNNTRSFQVVNHSRHNLYETLQDAVEKEAGVRCSIIVTPKIVSIRTKSLADYYLAKAVIRQRVSQEVVRDLDEPKAAESNSR